LIRGTLTLSESKGFSYLFSAQPAPSAVKDFDLC
jgi:hypothetical protein